MQIGEFLESDLDLEPYSTVCRKFSTLMLYPEGIIYVHIFFLGNDRRIGCCRDCSLFAGGAVGRS